MKYIFVISLILISNWLFAQLPNISQEWEKEFIDNKRSSYGFKNLSNEIFQNDFSKVIGNQVRMEGDPWSTFIGVFGPKNRRIDFHLKAEKETDTKYMVSGKSKLGSNIRELRGTIELKYALSTRWKLAKIMVFHYNLKEPGDQNGDGEFRGIGAFAFLMRDGEPNILWAESGDFREYNNMFVGIWNRFNSEITRECIFSFRPSGTHAQLPFRSYIYKEFGVRDECRCYFEIKDEIRQYGWEDYDDDNIQKTDWWKN